MNSGLRKQTVGDFIFNITNIFVMALIAFSTIYPFWYVLVISFNSGIDTLKGGVYFFPRVWTLENYYVVFKQKEILQGFQISILRTIIGTIVSVFFTAMVAYAISKKELYMRKLYVTLGTITMYFGGGLIPTFILISKWLGMGNKFIVYIIPPMFSFWGVVIFQGFFREIPSSLEESAKIDGANELYIFYKIVIPIAKPALATMALFSGVGHWNSWFDNYLYVTSPKLQTLSLYLYKTVNQFSVRGKSEFESFLGSSVSVTQLSVQCATIFVAIFPIIMIYPFLQKYFVKGIMIGSVKG